jgi:DUF2934 family protein
MVKNIMPQRKTSSFDPLRFVAPAPAPKPREALIAENAYFRAERRGFAPGHEEEDWLAAEAEIDARLKGTVPAAPRKP